MEEAVRQRLIEFLKNNRYSVNALSKLLDINQKTLNNQLSGVTALNINTVCSILNKFPELSAEWILRGEEGTAGADSSAKVEMLQQLLEEERQRSKEYWNMIQKLIENGKDK